MFMPEIGDEALVAFEHGDPERPYIIGALWNGVDSAPRQGFWDGEVMQSVGGNGTQVAADSASSPRAAIAFNWWTWAAKSRSSSRRRAVR
jgi:uncharacterized protein involved in type VI secretion and phage assembly